MPLGETADAWGRRNMLHAAVRLEQFRARL